MKAYQKTLKNWDEGIKEVGDVGEGIEVVALNKDEDGSRWAEVKRTKPE